MIDPFNITNYNRTQAELEEFILFCICVAGKTAVTTSKILTNILRQLGYSNKTPFQAIQYGLKKYPNFGEFLRNNGMGCYNQRAKSFGSLVSSEIDLKNCTVEELENIVGIGRKTSRFFLLHSRKNVKVAVLDTHVLKFLRSKGVSNVPYHTPGSNKEYSRLEQQFLRLCKNKNCAEMDLSIWSGYTKTKQEYLYA